MDPACHLLEFQDPFHIIFKEDKNYIDVCFKLSFNFNSNAVTNILLSIFLRIHVEVNKIKRRVEDIQKELSFKKTHIQIVLKLLL